jgi:hypothetical protein
VLSVVLATKPLATSEAIFEKIFGKEADAISMEEESGNKLF